MNDELTRACISSCQKCAAQCEQCAVACSLSPNVNSLSRCLELSIYCADMCRLTGVFLQRGEYQSVRFCALCAEICDICATECERFQDAACLRCALACRECAEVCRKVASQTFIVIDGNLQSVRETA
jgi:hypothetical protein